MVSEKQVLRKRGQVALIQPIIISHLLQTSQLICTANQVTGFYMMRNIVIQWFKLIGLLKQ